MIRRRPLGYVLAVTSFAAVIAVILVPGQVKLPVLVGALVLILLNTGEMLLQFRTEAAAANAVVSAHPGATILRTALRDFPGLSKRDRDRVVVVLADRSGLSFRDTADVDVARVRADAVLSIELAPLDRGAPVRPAVVTTLDGVVRFTVGVTPDQQLDAVVAIRTALGRPSG